MERIDHQSAITDRALEGPVLEASLEAGRLPWSRRSSRTGGDWEVRLEADRLEAGLEAGRLPFRPREPAYRNSLRNSYGIPYGILIPGSRQASGLMALRPVGP